VVGLRLEVAGQVVAKAGLGRGEIGYRRSTGPSGIVMDQSPKPGTLVRRGTPLNVIVSQTVEAVVPNVLRLPIPEAEAAIKRAGLRRGEVRSQQAPGPPGLVIDQSLKPGLEVERGTLLHLMVSQAIPAVVPNLLRLSVPEAEVAIKQAGLRRGEIRSHQAPGPPGMVIDQSLKPGLEVERGTALHLMVSQAIPLPPVTPSGGTDTRVIVPTVTNLPLSKALALIDSAGLTRGNVANRPTQGTPGIVLDQSLAPGTQVARETPLDLGVSQPLPPPPPAADRDVVIVPDTTTLTLEEALALIDSRGLARGNVDARPSAGPPDIVLDQSLAPGTEVTRGTPMHLGVSRTDAQSPPQDLPGATVLVPAVVGRDEAEARTLVDGVGLMVGVITERPFYLPPFLQPAGTVFAQEPAAGSAVAPTAVVDLVILQSVPAWAIALPVALLGAAGGALLVRRSPREALRRPPPPLPAVSTRVVADTGHQRMPSATDPVTIEIRVRPTIDRGRQSVREGTDAAGGAASGV
jgi:beta-lactam-binding protein with PASTA domain